MYNFDYKNMTPFKWFVLENFPFIENNFEAINNYRLFSKVVEYLNKTIDNVNVLGNLVEQFSEYFDNLDVQEEIDNKLDEMVEQGTLQEIIADYLNSKAIFAFDTVNDMKQATNLIDGSYAKTYGYYSLNDGGNATYKIRTITNNDSVDGMFKIAISNTNLIAELIVDDEINILKLGAKNDGLTDNYNYFNSAITYIINSTHSVINYDYDNTKTKIRTLYIPNGKYYISRQLVINENVGGMYISGESKTNTKLLFESDGILFNNGCLRCKFSDFAIDTKTINSSLFKITTGITHDVFFNNIGFFNSNKNLELHSCAYVYIDNCSFTPPINSDNEFLLKINGGEYCYITHCTFEGNILGNNVRNAIEIYNAWVIYITECDICNFFRGKGIYIHGNSYSLFFDKNSFVRNKYHVYVDINEASVDNISITNSFVFSENTPFDESFLYVYKESGDYILGNSIIDNLFIRGNVATTENHYYFNTGNYAQLILKNIRCQSNIRPTYSNSLEGKIEFTFFKTMYGQLGKYINLNSGTQDYKMLEENIYHLSNEYPIPKFKIGSGPSWWTNLKPYEIEYYWTDSGELYVHLPIDPPESATVLLILSF